MCAVSISAVGSRRSFSEPLWVRRWQHRVFFSLMVYDILFWLFWCKRNVWLQWLSRECPAVIPDVCCEVFSPCHLPLQVHRMLMLATSVLTCVAFVLPFVYRGGWSRVRMPSAACFPINLFWCQGRLLLYSQRWLMRRFCVHPFFLFLSCLMTSPGWGLGQKGDCEYRLLGTDVFLGCITSHAFL